MTGEAIEHYLGLDVPVHMQYGRWIGVLPTPDWVTGESHFKGLLQGTLGESLYGSGYKIEEEIISRLPVTIELGLLSIVIGLVIALPVGIYSGDSPGYSRRLRGAHRGHHRHVSA